MVNKKCSTCKRHHDSEDSDDCPLAKKRQPAEKSNGQAQPIETEEQHQGVAEVGAPPHVIFTPTTGPHSPSSLSAMLSNINDELTKQYDQLTTPFFDKPVHECIPPDLIANYPYFPANMTVRQFLYPSPQFSQQSEEAPGSTPAQFCAPPFEQVYPPSAPLDGALPEQNGVHQSLAPPSLTPQLGQMVEIVEDGQIGSPQSPEELMRKCLDLMLPLFEIPRNLAMFEEWRDRARRFYSLASKEINEDQASFLPTIADELNHSVSVISLLKMEIDQWFRNAQTIFDTPEFVEFERLRGGGFSFQYTEFEWKVRRFMIRPAGTTRMPTMFN